MDQGLDGLVEMKIYRQIKMIISKKEWKKLAKELVEKIKKEQPDVRNIHGVPRGGTLLAMYMESISDLTLATKPCGSCVIVDDLIDSGHTMKKYKKYPTMGGYKNYSFYALFDKRKMKEKKWIEFWYEDTKKDAEDLIVRQLEYIGEDPTREGLIDTPKRVINMWREIFRGYDKRLAPEVRVFNNGADGVVYDQMINDTGNFYSWCEHHMVNFSGNYFFAYVPHKNGKLIGLSKVARVVDYFSAKLQIQERLTHEVVDYIWNGLCENTKHKPLGIALVMEGEHLCKTMRGVKKKGTMRTTKLIGNFKKDPATRNEFIGWVNSFGRS